MIRVAMASVVANCLASAAAAASRLRTVRGTTRTMALAVVAVVVAWRLKTAPMTRKMGRWAGTTSAPCLRLMSPRREVSPLAKAGRGEARCLAAGREVT